MSSNVRQRMCAINMESTVTCPQCGFATTETMPADT